MCREFFTGYPEGVTTSDHAIDAFRVRVYEVGTPDGNVIYYHGGGFVVGGLESHDDVCAEICARTGLRVISVDYRLCPEFKHPAQFLDSFAALEWVLDRYDGAVVLAGDSAGGNLAATVSHAARGKTDRIIGQVLVYGGFGLGSESASAHYHANAPMLTRDDILFYRGIRCVGDEPMDDPTYAPLFDPDFTNLPPSVVIAAECDPIADDSKAYCDKLVATGNKAVWFNEAGLVHGYLRGRSTVTRARLSFDRIVNAIAALSRQEWIY